MAPRRGGGGGVSSGSSSSNACPGCNEPLYVTGYGFVPSNIAALAFAFICVIVFLIAYIMTFGTKIRNAKGKKSTFGARNAIGLLLIYQIIDIITKFLTNLEDVPLTRSYYIVSPLASFFSCFSDTFLAYAVYKILSSRQSVKGVTGLSKTTRIIGLIGTGLLAVLSTAIFAIQVTNTVYLINYSYSSASYDVVEAGNILELAHTSLGFVLALIAFPLAFKVFLGHRGAGIRSKAPLYLVSMITPFWFVRQVIILGISASVYTGTYYRTGRSIYLPLIYELVYNFLSVPIVLGLALSVISSEWLDTGVAYGGMVYPKVPHDAGYGVQA